MGTLKTDLFKAARQGSDSPVEDEGEEDGYTRLRLLRELPGSHSEAKHCAAKYRLGRRQAAAHREPVSATALLLASTFSLTQPRTKLLPGMQLLHKTWFQADVKPVRTIITMLQIHGSQLLYS